MKNKKFNLRNYQGLDLKTVTGTVQNFYLFNTQWFIFTFSIMRYKKCTLKLKLEIIYGIFLIWLVL